MEAMFALSGRYFIHAKEQFLVRILFYCSLSVRRGGGGCRSRSLEGAAELFTRIIRPGEQLTHLNSSSPETAVEFVIHF